MRRAFVSTLAALVLASPLAAQRRPARAAAVSPDSLRASLFAIAHDSMGGRATNSPGNFKTTEWVAAGFRRYGLEPAGENGTFFQAVGLRRVAPDTMAALEAGGTRLVVGRDIMPFGQHLNWEAGTTPTLFGGAVNDSTTWPAAGASAGKLVIMTAAGIAGLPPVAQLRRQARFAGARGFAVVLLDQVNAQQRATFLRGRTTQDTATVSEVAQLLISEETATRLLGAPAATAAAGLGGASVTGRLAFHIGPLEYAPRNVVAILRGTDRALRGTYVSITAHNDHVGATPNGVDHDSLRAFLRVVRPTGADSRNRPATAEEAVRIQQIRDSLRTAHAARVDTVFNGADDDGSGTVALVELARVLSSGPRPRRSILFVSHAAEEIGLVGSRWYTEHTTVPRDSIITEIDVDMIGRGTGADHAGKPSGYVELVGSKRLSTELGALMERVNGALPRPLDFNYEYDAPGHPQNFYCRADHYSYARFGIPSVSLSSGLHLDYHQLTDEPQYIDYDKLARVTDFVRASLLAVAMMEVRPVVDGPRQADPFGPCRQ